MTRLGPITVMALGVCCLFSAVGRAEAETKSEMAALFDKLCQYKPENEALVDWSNLVVKTPQTKDMDVQSMYRKMDDANKKAFRVSFLKSMAQSFQRSSHGHTLTEVLKKGMADAVEKGPHPRLILHQPDSKAVLTVLFLHKGKKLLFQGVATPEPLHDLPVMAWDGTRSARGRTNR